MMATNPHEFRNRTKKVDAMVSEIDNLARTAEIDPYSALGVEVILNMLDKWTSMLWKQCAVNVGSGPPSEQTRNLIKSIYRRRSAEVA